MLRFDLLYICVFTVDERLCGPNLLASPGSRSTFTLVVFSIIDFKAICFCIMSLVRVLNCKSTVSSVLHL